jgi:hypothetical protein
MGAEQFLELMNVLGDIRSALWVVIAGVCITAGACIHGR